VKRVKDKLKKRLERRLMVEPLENLALRLEDDPFFSRLSVADLCHEQSTD